MTTPASAGSGTSAAPPATVTDPLADLLEKLSDEVEELAQDIAAGKTAAQDATQQQRWVRSALTDLQRVEDVFDDVRAEAEKADEDAEKAVADVQGRIDALTEDERTKLKAGIDTIDEAIADKQSELQTAEQELATRLQKAREAADLVDGRAEALKAALGALTGISEQLKERASSLRRLATRIGTAAQAEQNRRVYALSIDIGVLRDELEGLLDENEHTARVTAYDDARKALAKARVAHAVAAKAVAEQERTVAARQRALATVRTQRQGELDKVIAQTT